LFLLKRRETLLLPLAEALSVAAREIKTCAVCGNYATQDPCEICADPLRETGILCVVEDVADLWALERSRAFHGMYHVLGGTLSALEGVRPEDLRVEELRARVAGGAVREVILALSATVEGQTTAHYVMERLSGTGARVTKLAHGLPVGGELDYLDDGTLSAALNARRELT